MGVLNRKVCDEYRKLKELVMCECKNQASLKVSKSASNPGRPFLLAAVMVDADSFNGLM